MQTALSGKVPSREVEVKFMKLNGCESIGNLENILSVFDDSCEDNFNKKEFVGSATTGRHGGTDVTYFNNNLFQQTRWSPTIDLNTSHIILFKSSRDVSN